MKNKSRWIVVLIIILVTGFSMVAYGQLKDVDKTKWYGQTIKRAKAGYIIGFIDGETKIKVVAE